MIIKCPECGNAVSTMAGTCPRCGVKIADNLVKCPQCGRFSLKGRTECPLCKADLRAQNEPQSPDHAQPEAKEQQHIPPQIPTPRRKRRGCLGWGCLMSFLLIVAAILGVFFYWTYMSKKSHEEGDYQRLQGVSNPEFYQQFLDDYPNSEHAEEVRTKMQHLQEEAKEWAEAEKKRNRISLTRFLQNYPNSVHERECRDLIDSIDWKEAASLNTEQAIENYMQNHPSGRYSDDATAKMIEFSQQKISDRDKSHIRGIMDAFFSNGMARGDLDVIGNAIPGTMTDFCGISPASPEQIAHFTSDKKAADVIGIHYLINADMTVKRDTLPDGQPAYAVSFSLDETVNRSDANQPSTKTYQVSSHLNDEKKIVDMTIK